MKPPADGWDREEQEALAPFQQELDAIRARHALSEHDKARLLRRIQQEAGQSPARARPCCRFWTRPWLLAAASVVIVAGALFLLRGLPGPSVSEPPAPERTVAVATPPPAPVYLLALDKPDLKVSPAALTYRSAAAENPLLADLKRAFDAFRADDYATADREFAALAPRYPKSVEVFFYQGISRLFLADAPGAIASLTTAGKIADSAFAWDIEWYRASRGGTRRQSRGGARPARSPLPARGHPRAQGLRRRQGTSRRQVNAWRSSARDVCRPRRRCCWSASASRSPAPSPSLASRAPQQTPAAAPVTASDIDALIGEAEGLLARRKPSDAKAVFDRALAGAQRLSLERQEGASHCGIASALRALAQYQPAHDSALRCLEIYSRIGFQPGVGRANLILSADGRVSRAACRRPGHARRAGACGVRSRRRRSWTGLVHAAAHPRESPHRRDRRALHAVVDAAVEAGDRELEASALHSWGDYLFNAGQLEDSLSKLERRGRRLRGRR